MADNGENRVPDRNEPDPQNERLRSFQGGADGLPDAWQAGGPARQVTYGHTRYGDDHGPADSIVVEGGGAGSGLSGMPQANAGNVPPLWAEPGSAPAPSEGRKD